jgi:hypothetical protein
MEKWFNKNLKWIVLVLFLLLSIKTFQSCSRKTSLRIQEKKLTTQCDSIVNGLTHERDSLIKEIISREFLIKDLSTELKIAGVKYDEAQKRADAIQKTAASIKANTTIEVKGVERDTDKK